MAAHYILQVAAGERRAIKCRLTAQEDIVPLPLSIGAFDDVLMHFTDR